MAGLLARRLALWHNAVAMRPFRWILLLAALHCVAQLCFSAEDLNQKLLENAERGDLSAVQQALKAGANANFLEPETKMTPLVVAVLYGHVQISKELLKAGANVDLAEANNSATPLMWASIVDPGKGARKKGIPIPTPEAKLEIVKLLLTAGARVNTRNSWGGTALQWAADEGNHLTVEALIAAKSDLNLQDNNGLSPLMAAANYDSARHTETVRMLIAAGADVKAKNKAGDTALVFAVNNFKTANVKALLAAGSDINNRNERGLTPLMRAGQLSRTDILQLLIEQGADLQTKNNDGKTALDLTREAGYKTAIDLLEKALSAKKP